MRKRVTFVEHLQKENLFKNGCGHIFMRSAELNKRCTDGFGSLPGQQEREMYRGTCINVPAGCQHMKIIHAPKSMMAAPFLQHPALSAGQTRYLWSIANVYSTEHMRRQMKQHYLDVLHACIQAGQSDTCRKKYGEHQHRENSTFTRDAGKDTRRTNKPQRQRKSNGRAKSDVVLPKIVNR